MANMSNIVNEIKSLDEYIKAMRKFEDRQPQIENLDNLLMHVNNLKAWAGIGPNELLPHGSIWVCSKCKRDDFDVKFMAANTNVAWSNHDIIKNLKKFTRNDSYYYNDMIKEECLIHSCKHCGFKEAIPVAES